jgi:hypothetical protein
MVTALRCLLRCLRAVATVALVVAVCRLVLGVWPTAAVLAAAAMWWGLRAWYRFENRLGQPRVLVPTVVARRYPRPTSANGHVAFARGLAAVSVAYLAECEREANRP